MSRTKVVLNSDIWALFNELIFSEGVWPAELARVLGCSEFKTHMLMKNNATLTAEDIRVLCLEYNVSADWLLGLKEDE